MFFRPKQSQVVLDTNTLDALGIVDEHLELLLIDENSWTSRTEQDHLLKLQEKINHYLHFLESKQYVKEYGDDFEKKVIHIMFQYALSDKGLAFLAQVEKTLEPTDISLKVTWPH